MATKNSVVPSYFMEKAKEFRPGVSPLTQAEIDMNEGKKVDMNKAVKDTVDGLKEAIEATRRRITEYKKDGADVSDLEFHLKNLEHHIEAVQKK